MIDPSTLEQLVLDVCHTMLGLPVARAGQGEETSPTMLASILISGAAEWLVEVEATATSARRIAAAMFDMPVPELSQEDVRDALGEIVNIIGGNVKGMMCTDAVLSLPCVEMREIVRDAGSGDAFSSIWMTIDGAGLRVRFLPGSALTTVA